MQNLVWGDGLVQRGNGFSFGGLNLNRLRHLVRLVACLIAWFIGVGSAWAIDDYIWIEGEAASLTNVKPHPWYGSMVDKSALSGGAFISNFAGQEGHAVYRFTAQQAGDYSFWVRANPVGDAKLDYQINGGQWTAVDFSRHTDLVNVANDGKTDLRYLAWTRAGTVSLSAGLNTVSFKFHSANNNHGSLDCFVFTQGHFAPAGMLKPGERTAVAEAGWWAFEPGPERFSAKAPLDLRSMNEKAAGQSGFVMADGGHFKLGDGR